VASCHDSATLVRALARSNGAPPVPTGLVCSYDNDLVSAMW
jgi:hypothetical protein